MGYVMPGSLYVCMYVCLLETLSKNYWTDPGENLYRRYMCGQGRTH